MRLKKSQKVPKMAMVNNPNVTLPPQIGVKSAIAEAGHEEYPQLWAVTGNFV
jgi:hypothetical protein